MNISKRLWALLLCLCMLASFAVQPAYAATANPSANATMTVSKTEVKVGDTITVTLSNKLINVQGFGTWLEFDKNLVECTAITGADGDEYLGLYKTSGKSPWMDAVADDVANTNSDGRFSFGVVPGADTEFKEGVFATLTFTAKAAGTVEFVLNEDTAGTSEFKGIAGTDTVTIASNVVTPTPNASIVVDKTDVKVGDTITVTLSNKLINVQGFGTWLEFDKNLVECTAITGADGDEYLGLYKTNGKSPWMDAVADDVANTNSDGRFSFGVVPGADTEFKEGVFATLTFTAKAAGTVEFVLNEDTAGTSEFKGVVDTKTVTIASNVVTSTPNASIVVDKTDVKVGDTITVTLSNKLINVQGFGTWLEFDKNLVECTAITGADGDEYLGLYKTSGKSPWMDAVADDVANTNSDGRFSFGVVPGADTEFKEGVFATLTFTAKAAGTVEFVLNEDTAGTSEFKGVVDTKTVTITAVAVHTCSGTFTKGQAATCTVDGWKDYYTCSCGKFYEDAACTTLIPDLAAWKKGAGKIAASHDYGTLVDEDPGVHTATEVKDGMKAHYFCDTCDTYFDSSKVPTTKEALTIKNQHSYTTQYGYKGNDGHADTCSCGAHNTVVGHTPNISAPTETEDQVCKFCGFVINPKTGHIHKNNLTPVAENGATCTEDGYKAHYRCSCGEYFEDASASVEIPDIAAWKAGKGKIAAEGHKYTEPIKDAAHLKSEATKCTEFDVYWYDCSVCDANAKNDPNATDKFWTSTDAGDHKFDEKLTDAAHLVAGTGANCQDAKKYYYDCAYCAEIGTSTWTSDSYGDHSFTEKLADAAHLVAGTGANCQDAKEYYYDCAHCAEIGTTSWVSTEMGDHDFDTTQWGYKDKATGHAHKCKYCTEHDTVQPHTPGAPATETEDQICTTCLLVLEPATGHICKSHLTKVAAEPATCTKDGNIEYYTCSCGKWYTDATASVEITDKDSVVIKAGHNYGTIVAEEPAVHTATELKAGMKAHYFCDVCDTYFTAEKVATTESELIIPAPVHEYNTVNGYKEADGHADTCSCGAHNTVVPHTPDREAATENDPIKCSVCGYEIAPALGHIHKNNLTKVPAETADCEKDGNIEYYICSCGKYYTDATASVEITDKDSVVIKGGHKYGELVQEVPAKHTATEQKDGMKAHYFCDECDTYFTAEKVATTKDALVIANAHSHGTEWKSDKDNHWNECACGDKANSAAHKDENSDGKCDVCEYNVGNPGGDKPNDNPQTGDNSMIAVWMVLMSVSALACLVLFKKRKAF